MVAAFDKYGDEDPLKRAFQTTAWLIL